MRVAAYCRKSTEDERIDDNKSVERQKIRCREFAASKGWIIEDADIYVDDGISGAEFTKRDGLNLLWVNLKNYNVIITADLDRLGRDALMNSWLLDKIINDYSIDVWYYQSGLREKMDTPEARMMFSLRSFAAEMERANAALRSRDTLLRKAKLGHVTGGKVYGYKNVPKYNLDVHGNQIRSHTEHEILEPEASVVRAIFTMYADGLGYRQIARTLNGDSDEDYAIWRMKYLAGALPKSPSAGKRGTGSWSPSCIQPMLNNERYIGLLSYGKYQKVRQTGRKNKRVKQENFETFSFPALRIVDQDLWEKVQLRIKQNKDNYDKQSKNMATNATATIANHAKLIPNIFEHPQSNTSPKKSNYLLAGFARCQVCGANIVVVGGKSIKKPGVDPRQGLYYGCSINHNRGKSVCINSLRYNMLELDALVMTLIKDELLSPKTCSLITHQAKELLSKQAGESKSQQRIEQFKTQITKAERELKNLLAYMIAGTGPKTLLETMTQREQQRDELVEALKREETLQKQRSQFNAQELEAWLNQTLPQLERLLSESVEQAREVLHALLAEPMTIGPIFQAHGGEKGKTIPRYVLSGTTTLGAVFRKINSTSPTKPNYPEPKIPDSEEEKPKAKYRISGRATLGGIIRSASYIKLASPRGFEPRLSP